MYSDVAMFVNVDVGLYCINVEPEILHLLKTVIIDDRDPGTHHSAICAVFREGEGGVDGFVVLTS